VFYHWKKLRDTSEDEHVKYAKRPGILYYKDEDYNQHFVSTTWSKAETDYLLKMCALFDCRFIVIQDRWEMSDRTVEDIKDRFYSVQRKLIELNGTQANDTSWKKHPLIKFPYDKSQDETRRMQLKGLLKRDVKQIKEEDELTPKVQEILKVFKTNRKESTRIIDIAQKFLTTPFSETPNKRNKKRRKSSLVSIANLNYKAPRYRTGIKNALENFGLEKPEKNAKTKHTI